LLAIRTDSEAGGVGGDVEARRLAVAQSQGAAAREALGARLELHHYIVDTAGGVEALTVRRPDKTDIAVGEAEHLALHRLWPRHIIEEQV
ncbi:hypothetical protein C1X78_26130, partial [Pseudomonas sp. MPR-R1B]